MNTIYALLIFLFLVHSSQAKHHKQSADGFVSLFNGKDLTGWQTTGNWLRQKDGSLLIQPKPGQEGWQRYSDYLISKEKFGDFILQVGATRWSDPLRVRTAPQRSDRETKKQWQQR